MYSEFIHIEKKVILIGLSILSMIFIIDKMPIIKKIITKKRRCNLEIKGKIIDRWTEQRWAVGRKYNYETFVLVEYEYNNKTYAKEARISPLNHIRKGDIVTVWINPNDPEECHSFQLPEEQYKERITWKDWVIRLILLLPVISIIIVVIMIWLVDNKYIR